MFIKKTLTFILKSNSGVRQVKSLRSPKLISRVHRKKSISNACFVVFLSRGCQYVENVHETFTNTKIAFQSETKIEPDLRLTEVPWSFPGKLL